MMKTAILVISLLFLISPGVYAENIYALIKEGQIQQASDSLSKISSASTRDGNQLFFQALLEQDAGQSARLMEAALKTSVAAVYRQEIYYLLAQYYFIENENTRLSELVLEYLAYWENGKYRQEMLRFSILLSEKEKAFDTAIRQIDRYLMEYRDGDANQWGLIDKARVMAEYQKDVAAYRQLKKLTNESSGPGVALALYLLTVEAIDNKNIDNAVFYYNLLKEGYPHSVGTEFIVDKMGTLTSLVNRDNTAEKLTGTYYSVQVGVFSENDNAKKQAEVFKAYNKKIDIKNKKISSNNYHVVYVGRFSNYNDAVEFKKMLEANHKEVYQVVAR